MTAARPFQGRVPARLRWRRSAVDAAVDRLLAEKRLVGDRRVARADFKPRLSANLRKLKDKVVAAYLEARFQPPEPSSFADTPVGNAASLKTSSTCVAEGFLVHVAGELYLHADADADIGRRVKERLSQQGGGLTVAEIRDLRARLANTPSRCASTWIEWASRGGKAICDGRPAPFKVLARKQHRPSRDREGAVCPKAAPLRSRLGQGVVIAHR